MFYRAPIGSPERQRFLGDTREALLESFERPEVTEALGSSVVQRLRDLNDLLYVATIDGEDTVITPSQGASPDAIPIVALKEGEAVQISREMALPSSPRQAVFIRRFLDTLVEGEATVEQISGAETRLIQSMRQTIPPWGKNLQLPPKSRGTVYSSTALIDGDTIGLGHSPGPFVLSGHPRVVLRYSGGYPRPVVLAHELLHVEQALVDVITPYNEEALMRRAYRHELEAHHHSALYMRSLYPVRHLLDLKSLWAHTKLPFYEQVENIRQKYADPEHPFEPNDQLMEELRKQGIVWDPFEA